MGIIPAAPGTLDVVPGQPAVLDVDMQEQGLLDVVMQPQAVLGVVMQPQAVLTLGEICTVSSGTLVVLAASDGVLRTRDGGYFLLDPATNPPESDSSQ